MDRIVIVKGDDLASLIDFMEAITTGRERAYQLRVTIDNDQVKLKVNGSTWTPGYGELDPECQSAATRDLQGRPMHYGNNDRTACGKWSGMVYRYTDNRAAVTCPGCLEALIHDRPEEDPEIRSLFPTDPPA